MKQKELKNAIQELLIAAEAERTNSVDKEKPSSYYQWGRASALREVLDLL